MSAAPNPRRLSLDPYYDDGTVTIYHGDSRDILPLLEADVMVTDPPYGLAAPLNSGGRKGYVTPKDKRAVPDWDKDLEARDAILATAATRRSRRPTPSISAARCSSTARRR